MAAHLIDIDGTVVHSGGGERFLPGAVRMLQRLLRNGHQVIFTTARPSAMSFKAALRREGLPNLRVITGVENPRVLINNDGALAVNHPTNAAWR